MDTRKEHLAKNIVFITVLALISNATDWEEIADFGQERKDFIVKCLNLSNRISYAEPLR